MSDKFIKAVPLFEGLSAKEVKNIQVLLKEEWFEAGANIVQAEDEGGRLYILTEGKAKVIVNGETVRTVGPGDYIGEMSLMDGSPRSGTVTATESVKTVWLSRLSFLSLLQENPIIAQHVITDLVRRIRNSDRQR